MWMRRWACPLALLVPLVTAGAAAAAAQAPLRVASPDGRNEVTVRVRDGRLYYSLQRDGRAIFLPSLLGFALGSGLLSFLPPVDHEQAGILSFITFETGLALAPSGVQPEE